jgi:hypothetical protein
VNSRQASARTLVLVLLAAALAFGGITAVFFFSQSSLRIETSPGGAAFAEMDRVRARYGDAVPCVQARDQPPADRRGPQTSRTVRLVHMLAWEREDDRLVRASTPYWALRSGTWKLRVARGLLPQLEHVGLPEIDTCGPGLILDRRTSGGGRVVIWAE